MSKHIYSSRADPHKEAIIADYRRGDMSVVQIAKRYDLTLDIVHDRLKRWGEHDPSRIYAFAPRKGFYQVWVEQYGIEEAERLRAQHTINCTKGARRGKDHHQYGKAAPKRSGYGWKGWYKQYYFRSLKEAAYMLGLDEQGFSWQSAEHLSIPYTLDGRIRTYHPDYLVGDCLVEIKPKGFHSYPCVLAKRAAAEIYCTQHGLTYELIDVTVNNDAIKVALDAGLIRFDADYRERFLTSLASHKG